MSRLPRWLNLLVRLLVAVTIYVLLAGTLDLGTLLRQIQALDWGWLATALIIPLCGIVLSAYRWRLSLGMLGVWRSYRELLLRYWGGTFYNLVLPTSIGGDLLRVGGLRRSGVGLSASTLSVLLDRLLGLWAGMLIGLLASLWPSALPQRAQLGLLFAAVAAAIPLALLLSRVVARRLGASAQSQPLLRRVAHLGELMGRMATRKTLLLVALCLLFQSLVVLHLYTAAQAVGSPLSPLAAALYAPAVALVTLLPISLNGLGLREASLVVLLGAAGVSAEQATLMGLLIYLTNVLSSLPGGLAIIALGKSAP